MLPPNCFQMAATRPVVAAGVAMRSKQFSRNRRWGGSLA
jgi:hypothetical protein